MPEFVALLRGINLGNRRIKMDALRAAFTDMGYENVRTLIASGNVVFEAESAEGLSERLEAGLSERFGFLVPAIVRSMAALHALVASDPFSAYAASDDTKFYVYFLAEPEGKNLQLPIAVEGDFEIFAAHDDAFFSVMHRQANGRFGSGMDKLKLPISGEVTNRNWNTVLRLVEMAN